MHETALSKYGKMVSKTDHTFETLRSDTSYRDKDSHYCDVKAFKACLVTYNKWYKGKKGHVDIKETSFTMQAMEILKALGDETLKPGARATQQNENRECYERIESELQEIFSSEENVSCLQFAIEEDI